MKTGSSWSNETALLNRRKSSQREAMTPPNISPSSNAAAMDTPSTSLRRNTIASGGSGSVIGPAEALPAIMRLKPITLENATAPMAKSTARVSRIFVKTPLNPRLSNHSRSV